ncbi:MAG: hypothetical protein LBI26_01015 [Holosporales bacterium]|jgi:SulP family sulfate permease|nr:hypothetical protein [Holosporales bacterium]
MGFIITRIKSIVRKAQRFELCPSIFNIHTSKSKFFISDIFSAIKIFLSLLPLVFAWSFAIGLSPIQGLATLFAAAIVSIIFGGSKYQISLISFALSVITIEIIAKYQYNGMLLVSIFVAIILIIFGLLRLNDIFKRLYSSYISAITIYVSLYIIVSQTQYILGITSPQSPSNLINNVVAMCSKLDGISWQNVLTALYFVIPLFIIKIKIKNSFFITIYLALSITSSFFIDLKLFNISDFGNINTTYFGNLSSSFVINCINYSLAIAIVIASTSCLTTNLSSSLTGTRLQHNAEFISLGIANFISVILGGVFVSSNTNYTMQNIAYKTKTLGTLLMLGCLSLVTINYYDIIIEHIPVYSLSAILIVFAIDNIKLKHFKLKNNDDYIFIATLLVLLFFGFVPAVYIGFIISLMFLAQRMISIKGESIHVTKKHDASLSEFMAIKNGFIRGHNYSKYIDVIHIEDSLFLNTIKIALESRKTSKVIILYFKHILFLDAEAIRILKYIVSDARKNNVMVIVSGANGILLEMLKYKEKQENEGSIFGYIVPNFGEALKKAHEKLGII